MSLETFQSPRLRNMVIGGLLAAAIITAFVFFGELTKFTGSLFLIIPDKLGLIEQVSSEEVLEIDLDPSDTIETFTLTKPGHYAIYTRNIDLLSSSKTNEIGFPPIKIIQLTGEEISVSYVQRGLRLYDTPFASGRPILSFEIKNPGVFHLSHPRLTAIVSVVPDYVSGHETVINLVVFVQIAVITIPLGAVYYHRHRIQRYQEDNLREEKRSQSDDFWGRERSTERKTKESEQIKRNEYKRVTGGVSTESNHNSNHLSEKYTCGTAIDMVGRRIVKNLQSQNLSQMTGHLTGQFFR